MLFKQLEPRKIILGAVIVAIAVFVGCLIFPTRGRIEPVYQGKTLTQWLKRLDDGEAFGISSHALPSPTTRQMEAAEAIRAIGTNALPFLMEDIHATPAWDSFRFKLQDSVRKVAGRSSRLSDLLQGLIGDITEEDRVRWRASQGLAALGPLARSEVPELKRLLFTNYFHSSIKEAAYALATVGPEGIEILTNAPRRDEWSGMCAIWALGQHPAAGTNVIPFLMSLTTSASEGTACGAIQVLGLYHTQGEQVVPVLMAALTNANPAVRRDAAWALGHFGPQAARAIPLIEPLTNSPDTKAIALEVLKRLQSQHVK